ncbi:hypothetical protein [Halobacteriovorax sp. DA5]|uniref:hypothetical protein n=1 Tax=unclassified Halobacteriovorax TaxID=2639665 RepID=UPI0011AF893A|nr:hypothetical protein [Halobacteriovorax sp. DA5]
MRSIILTSVLCSGICQAMPSQGVVKVSDGARANCNEKKDLYRNKLQAYKVKNYSSKQIGDNIELTLNIQMLQCSQTDKSFAFKEKNIFDLFTYKTFRNIEMEVRTKSANILFYQDGIYKKLSQVDIIDNQDLSKITASFNVKDLLTKEKYEKYLNGEKVITSLDFSLKRLIEVSGNDFNGIYDQNYGGFRVFFEIK